MGYEATDDGLDRVMGRGFGPGRAQAVVFAGCAGWLHEGGGAHAAILCGPIGQEALAVHDGWRMLCDQLAASGVTALRFDYPGTGDSAGDESDADRIGHWVDSVVAASDWLCGQGGVRQVSLIGLRMGAAVAALAAARVGADRLILINPVISGRKYLRELRLLARTWWLQSAPDQDAPATPEGALDVVGYRWTAPSLEALSAVDLTQADQWPREVVVIDGTGRPEVAAFAEMLRGRGVSVAVSGFDGGAEFLQDALLSVPPQDTFDEICTLLAPRAGLRRDESMAGFRLRGVQALSVPGAVETPLAFGPGGALYGILCRPDGVGRRDVVLLLNTGFTCHVGHARLNVLLARALAGLGVASLRMDGAGVGDSGVPEGRPGRLLHDTRAAVDISAAIDALVPLGLDRVTALGLCTGGYQAFHAALVDRRIAAIIPVNTQKFIWMGGPSFNVSYDGNRRATGVYLRAALKRAHWGRAIRGEVNVPKIVRDLVKRSVRTMHHRAMAAMELRTGRATRAGQLRRWIAELSARNVRVRMFYSEADPGLADLCFEISPAQLQQSLPGFTLEILRKADHTLSDLAARDDFICRVLDQFDRRI